MKREVIDHSQKPEDFSFLYGQRTLYIFYQNIKQENYIVIYANSYLEAKNLLYSFNPYASYVYNLNEYKLQHVNGKYLFDICKIDPDWCEVPVFITKSNYKKLLKYIVDKQFTNINHNKVITPNLWNKMGLSENKQKPYNCFTTQEFVNMLKNNMEDKVHIKKIINEQLINKYPLFKTHIITRSSNFDLYTNSKEQTAVVMNKMREYDNNILADYMIYNKDFITGTDEKSINNYRELNKQLQENKNNCSFKDIKTPFFMFGNNYQEYNSYMLPKKEN